MSNMHKEGTTSILATVLLLGLILPAKAFGAPRTGISNRHTLSASPLSTTSRSTIDVGDNNIGGRLHSLALPLENDGSSVDFTTIETEIDGAVVSAMQLAVPVGERNTKDGRRRDAREYLRRKRDKARARAKAKKKILSGAEAELARHQQILESDDLDAMRARAGVLRRSIVAHQMQLTEMERRIACLQRPAYPISLIADLLQEDNPAKSTLQSLGRSMKTLTASTEVLMRKLRRVQGRQGATNKRWNSVAEFVDHQRKSGVRIVEGLVRNPQRLQHLVDPQTPTLVAHVPAILARLDKLEDHVAPILERVLNNRRHLASVEPYLDLILERFDDIEPHLPWILENIDALAPYTGLLLKHIDELLLFAEAEEHETSRGTKYDLAEQLLPHLESYVSRLDVVGPHLPLLRPHVPLLLKNDHLAKITPHIDKLFARGYNDLSASANLDVLLYWFGWSLRIPFLPKLFFALPWSPRIVSFLANRMPKRFVRGNCADVTCVVDNYYFDGWNKMEKS